MVCLQTSCKLPSQNGPRNLLLLSVLMLVVKVLFPATEIDRESGTVTGSSAIAPGMVARALLDFLPATMRDYHDVLRVVTEAGTFEVCITLHRVFSHQAATLAHSTAHCWIKKFSRDFSRVIFVFVFVFASIVSPSDG